MSTGSRHVDPATLPRIGRRRHDYAPGMRTPRREHGRGGRALKCYCETCTDSFRIEQLAMAA